MNLQDAIYRLEDKAVSVNELARCFDTKSLDELLQKLQRLSWADYFKLEVSLSPEYFKWQSSHRELIFGNEIVESFDYAYRVMRERDTYGLSVSTVKPLTDEEISEVARKLPTEIANQYLRFKLQDISVEALLVELSKGHNMHNTDGDEFYDRIEYKGLAADGSEITYKGKPVVMGFQHRQVLRMLLERQGKLCTKDELTDNQDIFTKDDYPNLDTTLRKLIGAVRRVLTGTIGFNCIKNIPSEGWYLEL